MRSVFQGKKKLFQLLRIGGFRLRPEQLNRVVESLTTLNKQVVTKQNLTLRAKRSKFLNNAERLLGVLCNLPQTASHKHRKSPQICNIYKTTRNEIMLFLYTRIENYSKALLN